MATRSRIGLQLANGSVLSVYCHWDGYPKFNGVKLVEHFNSFQKAAGLIDGGDISSLWTDKGWDDTGVKGVYGPQYYSQRGLRGEFTAPRHDKDLIEYLSDGEEYAYLFANNEWVCYDLHETPKIVEINSVALAV